ncbi:MAG: glycosyltransferase [Solirubrobacterales bacterium]
MRILLICTRDPSGRRSGRKAVLATIVNSLRSLGHSVEALAITKDGLGLAAGAFSDVTLHRIAPPSVGRIAWNLAVGFPSDRLSLNECLYYSPRIAHDVRALSEGGAFDLVVADTLRTAKLGLATSLPLVVDLDDLLSLRYADLIEGHGDVGSLLGYYGESMPRLLARLATGFAARLLRREAALLERREVWTARTADAVSLVGSEEAAELSRRSGRPVACLPMAVDVSGNSADVASNPSDRFVCVGGMDYRANVESLRWFAGEPLTAARRACPGFHLEMIGHCPKQIAEELTRPGLSFLGYVDDLSRALRGYRGFVAPITSGTGVKTKVIEAMAAGLPVVSTPLGVAGIAAQHGVDCLVGSSPSEFAEHIHRISARPEEAAAIGQRGRQLVKGSFSAEVIEQRWADVLRQVGERSALQGDFANASASGQ